MERKKRKLTIDQINNLSIDDLLDIKQDNDTIELQGTDDGAYYVPLQHTTSSLIESFGVTSEYSDLLQVYLNETKTKRQVIRGEVTKELIKRGFDEKEREALTEQGWEGFGKYMTGMSHQDFSKATTTSGVLAYALEKIKPVNAAQFAYACFIVGHVSAKNDGNGLIDLLRRLKGD